MSYVAAVFNVLVCIALPLGVLVALLVKRRPLAFSFVLGVGTFLVSQMFTRIPLLNVLRGQPGFVVFEMSSPALYAILLGLSAGVFEEGGRYLAMRFVGRGRIYADALAFGAGHGGVEAFLVGLNSLFALLAQPDALVASPPLMVALSGIERLFAMLLHVGLSVMVMHAVAHHRVLWLGLAVLAHTLADAAIGLFRLWGLGTLAVEGWLVLVSLAAGGVALALGKQFSSSTQPQKEIAP